MKHTHTKHFLRMLMLISAVILCAFPARSLKNRSDFFLALHARAKQNPEQVLPQLDSLEQSKTYPQSHINFFRSCAYHSLSRYYMSMYYARSVIQHEDTPSDTLFMKGAYSLLAESAVASYHLNDAIRYIDEGRRYAARVGDPVLEANMRLMEGEVYRRLGMLEKGYQCLRGAMALLKDSVDGDELYCRSRIMGYFMKSCIEDRRSAEAWEVGLKREEVIARLEQIPAFASGIDEQKAYLYSKMAYLAQRLKKFEMADSFLKKFNETAMASTLVGKLEINDYLLAKGAYRSVLDHATRYLASLDEKDSMSVLYIRTMFQSSRAYQGVGNYKEAYEAVVKLRGVMETMRMSAERSELFDLADLTQAMRQEYELKQAETDLRVRNWVIAGLVLVALVLIGLLARIYAYWKAVRAKNAIMASMILELNEKNSVALAAAGGHDEGGAAGVEDAAGPDGRGDDRAAEASGEEQHLSELFAAFHRRVCEDRMYLNYQLSRDDYAQVMGVDRNRFAAVLKAHGHGNLNAYLNNLRLEYSVTLFRDHPDWPISKIASECALPSLSTFYRLFKEKYGMSPNAFRNNLSKNEEGEA